MGKAEIDIKGLKARILINAPFFGYLLLSLEDKEWEEPTWGTDGKSLFYNLNMGFTPKQYLFVMMHEIYHNALLHCFRRGERNAVFENTREKCPKCQSGLVIKGNALYCQAKGCSFREPYSVSMWNVAADYAVNNDLVAYMSSNPDIGGILERPAGTLISKEFQEMSAEQIYDKLLLKYPSGGGLSGRQEGDDSSSGQIKKGDSFCHGVMKPDIEISEHELKQKIIAASMMQKGRGSLPAGLQRLIDEITESKIDWRTATSRFVQEVKAMEDYTWERPSKKYISSGLYLPDNMGNTIEMAVGVDTSGSISAETLKQFVSGELRGICSSYKTYTIHVMGCDASVDLDIEITENTTPEEIMKAGWLGGGGTDFRPVFKRIAERRWPISCLIFMTDADGTFPEEEPQYPVLWLVEGQSQVPFGTRIQL